MEQLNAGSCYIRERMSHFRIEYYCDFPTIGLCKVSRNFSNKVAVDSVAFVLCMKP